MRIEYLPCLQGLHFPMNVFWGQCDAPPAEPRATMIVNLTTIASHLILLNTVFSTVKPGRSSDIDPSGNAT